MAQLMDRIKQSLAKQGLTPGTNAARTWLRSKVKDLAPSKTALMKDREKLRDSTIVGKMYFYFYEAKTKKFQKKNFKILGKNKKFFSLGTLSN